MKLLDLNGENKILLDTLDVIDSFEFKKISRINFHSKIIKIDNYMKL